MNSEYDVIVVGGGPAGLAAACAARESGAERVLVVERDKVLGGILNQCIHNGFGLHYFKEELTGPEYAERFVERAEQLEVSILLDTMVLSIENHMVTACNAVNGLVSLHGKAIVLAMGCRERTRGAVAIPGDRPAGIYTAGTAQRYINIEGWMVGKRVVCLGSGDIGLIMARRLTLEGAKVLACVELMPYCNGLNRNIVQCLEDYNIPLYLSHTVTNVEGLQRVERVTVSQVGPDRKPIPGTEMVFDCDTLLLSVGLIPENELTRNAGIPLDTVTQGPCVYENMETMEPGVFSCGNVVHVHDLVDFVTEESYKAGMAAAQYARGEKKAGFAREVAVRTGEHITYTVPQHIRLENVQKAVDVSFRVNAILNRTTVEVSAEGRVLCRFNRAHMAPGEMEHITIPSALLNNVPSNMLVVSAIPAAEE